MGTSTCTFGSPFDVVDSLSCDARFLYAFQLNLKPMAVLLPGRSSTLSNPALFKISMPFFIASAPVRNNRFQICVSERHAASSVSTRDPPISYIRILHFRMDHVAVAQLIFPGTSTDECFRPYVLRMEFTLSDRATTLPIMTRNLFLPRSSTTAPYHQSNPKMSCSAILVMCLLTVSRVGTGRL